MSYSSKFQCGAALLPTETDVGDSMQSGLTARGIVVVEAAEWQQ
jgi:hypothetical protein